MLALSSQQDAHAAAQARPRIILAEDDQDMRQLLASALSEDGYDVIEIADGAELLQAIHSRQHQRVARGIISDIQMPLLSGFDVLADLRSTNPTIPVILITAFGDERTHAAARMLGVAAVFNKPFDVDDLRTAVLNIMPPRHGTARKA